MFFFLFQLLLILHSMKSCNVPRPSSSLSSSFTPFYPRSQQQRYHSQPGSAGCHDGRCYGFPQKPDDNTADNHQPYVQPYINGPNCYNYSNYASLGSEPYEVSWIPEGFYGGNMWGCLSAWGWGDPALVQYAYADGEAEHSAEPPPIVEESYTSSPSNTASLPAPFHGQDATVASGVLQSSALPEQEKWTLAEGISNEVASGSAVGKLDGRSTLDKQSSQMPSSDDVEPATKQVTANTAKKDQFQTENNKLRQNSSNSKLEHRSVEGIQTKASIHVSTNSLYSCESLEGTKLDPLTICLESLPAEIVQEDVGSKNSLSVKSSGSSLISTGGCTCSQHVNAQPPWSSPCKTSLEQENCCGSPVDTVKAPLVMGTVGRPCDEVPHHEKIGSVYDLPLEVGLCSNGSQLLIKSIYNLSKVILTCQSGGSSNGFHHGDLAIENSICMLSHCLLQQYSVNEADICHCQQSYQGQSQAAQQDLKRPDVAKVLDDEAGIQNFQKKSLRPMASTRYESTVSPAETGPCWNNEGLENFFKVSMRSRVEEDKISSVKKHLETPLKELLELQGKLMELQEEIAYERSMYSEAQEALEACKSERMKMRAQLDCLKQASRKLKHTEGCTGPKGKAVELEFTNHDMDSSCINQEGLYENFLDVVTNSSQNLMTQYTCKKQESDGNSGFCGSSGKGLPKNNKVLTGYFDPMKIVRMDLNCTQKNGASSLLENEKAISRHTLQEIPNQNGDKFGIVASKPLAKCGVEPPTDLENRVAQHQSLPLAKQGLDLNVTCTDGSPSDVNNFSRLAANVLREGETMPPNKRPTSVFQQQVPFQYEKLYAAGAKKQVGCERADSSCLMKSDLDPKDVWADILRMSHGQVEKGHRSRAAESEDEEEIICFRPSDKGEAEWEHVVVLRDSAREDS